MTQLTHIHRGLVRIEKNAQLCFAETIDWTVIANQKDDHYMRVSILFLFLFFFISLSTQATDFTIVWVVHTYYILYVYKGCKIVIGKSMEGVLCITENCAM